jgi:hypothetical protein
LSPDHARTLVPPDGFVAWRATTFDEQALADALGSALCRTTAAV